ncbi:hypothetical protein [Methanohalobium sp.]|uniref:hypothetical protein n=1 Tax=Methanohalobium sp. TaxID=2837493 RepID=UPI0025E61EA8|nr:hypothetical protein [Methanohalobium sp.]
MGFKIKALLIAAVLCLAFTGLSSAATDAKCTWEKPCGTQVEQCDEETTFLLNDTFEGTPQIIVNGGEWYYVDMDGDGIVSAGDIRLTGWHETYEPNTKVMSEDDDNLKSATVLDEQDIITYWDINGNDKFDLYDPVYVDVNNDSEVSNGDIRLTDVPPVDVYSLDDSNLGDLMYNAGELNDADNQKWSVVSTSADAGEQGDMGEPLNEIGDTGNIADLIGYVDADDSGDWSCEDKLYIKQPHVITEDRITEDGNAPWFDEAVTIGDVRLYIPPDEECVPECGTKVVQGDHDVTYALMPKMNADIAYYEDGKDEIYLDMDNSGDVSFGDVRLTSVSNTFEPNTKVGPSNAADLEHPLVDFDNQNIIRYADIDGNAGFSVGDPLYIDADNSTDVSDGDVRLNDVPVFDQDNVAKGEFGDAWSVVENGQVNPDSDVGWDLGTIGDVGDIIGYVDSDCTQSWTCPDKLYIQQFTEGGIDNFVVTNGDHRLYEPFNDPTSPFYQMEDWYECGTKVLCDEDTTYTLKNPGNIFVGFIDRDGSGDFTPGDAAYINMDNDSNMQVTDGDVRLNNITITETVYEANTKVKSPHDKDLDFNAQMMDFEGDLIYADGLYIDADDSGDVSEYDLRLTEVTVDGTTYEPYTMVMGGDMDVGASDVVMTDTIEDHIMWYDTDCSGTWTCVDALYLQDKYGDMDWNADDDAVTHHDLRLFIPPDMVSMDDNDCHEGEDFWMNYDADNSGTIDKSEVMNAINGYFASIQEEEDNCFEDSAETAKPQVMNVINKFFEGL